MQVQSNPEVDWIYFVIHICQGVCVGTSAAVTREEIQAYIHKHSESTAWSFGGSSTCIVLPLACSLEQEISVKLF